MWYSLNPNIWQVFKITTSSLLYLNIWNTSTSSVQLAYQIFALKSCVLDYAQLVFHPSKPCWLPRFSHHLLSLHVISMYICCDHFEKPPSKHARFMNHRHFRKGLFIANGQERSLMVYLIEYSETSYDESCGHFSNLDDIWMSDVQRFHLTSANKHFSPSHD